MIPEYTIYALWGAWVVSWIVAMVVSWIGAMVWSNRTEKTDRIGAELFFRVLIGVGWILLFALPPNRHYYAQIQLWYLGEALNWILVALAAAGLHIVAIRDVTPIPHNGCRPPKRRRV